MNYNTLDALDSFEFFDNTYLIDIWEPFYNKD
jgi:hypothetical protein